MYKIGVISPPSLFTGGFDYDNQPDEIRSEFVDFINSVSSVETCEVYLDTFFPLSQCLAQIAMLNDVSVTRVQSFKKSPKEFKKIPQEFVKMLELESTCSGLLVLNAGKYTPKKVHKSCEYIARNTDHTFVIGPKWYSGYGELSKNCTCFNTPFPKDFTFDLHS